MGSPKTTKNVKQSIWRRRIGAPFAVVLVVAVVAFVFLSEEFAQGPNASLQYTPVNVENTRRPMREFESGHLAETRSNPTKQEGKAAEEKIDAAELAESSNKETPTPNQEEKTGNPDSKEAKSTTPEADLEERSTEASGDASTNTKCTPPAPGAVVCDLSNPRFDLCELCGDARAIGQSSTVVYVPRPRVSDGEEWSIRAQSRKSLPWIKKVTVKSLNASQSEPSCTSSHAMPAIVFALGGLTANVWHDFSDVLVPLFLTARQFDGDVQLLVTDIQPWFLKKYAAILRRLTRHGIVDFDADDQVRCYPHVIVGLRSHRDLSIDPGSSLQNYTMVDFRLFVREAYDLPAAGVDIPYKADKDDPNKKPRVMLIDRAKTRRFMNTPHVTQGLEWFGIDVVTADPKADANLDEFARLVDSCDAIMGAHGAGLTNMVFLRSGGVVVHIVPYGIEFMADGFYGAPARDMGLRHVQYSISAEESTLLEKYGWNHTVIKDPEAVRNSGWDKIGEFYMSKQDIVLNMTRFGPSLLKALEFIM